MKLGRSTREAFGLALAELGERDAETVVLDADVHNSTRTEYFAQRFPKRFFNVGIAESNVVSVASGLAASGKRPWLASFACFIMCNAFDQLRMSVAFPALDVKVVGSHAGISIGEDGPSQMGIEDIALACALPNFTVVVPADEASTHKAVFALAEHRGPAYLRVGRPNVPVVYEGDVPFTLGRANCLREGRDVTIVANGLMVWSALQAAEELAQLGIRARVLDIHTVKPLDHEALAQAARETGRIVVAEEHLKHGGLGSVVAQSVAEQHPVPMRFVALNDTYAESGAPQDLLRKYGLTAADIVRAARSLVQR
ncbi:MAG: transketolase family protein [Gemmatales bacterium]|nr:transketolase family protein [Gemmatales bacterium]MDW8222536.1 transketolase family protein [Gemmatales bacterium]